MDEIDMKYPPSAKTTLNFSKLLRIFSRDPMFRKLCTVLVDKYTYFNNLSSTDRAIEISWWIERTNISCIESGLVNQISLYEFSTLLWENQKRDDFQIDLNYDVDSIWYRRIKGN